MRHYCRSGRTQSGRVPVHIAYLLSSHTVDGQLYDLINQKWAAQRACTEDVLPSMVLRKGFLCSTIVWLQIDPEYLWPAV